MKLKLKASQLRRLLEAGEAEWPREACGLLLGFKGEGEVEVVRAVLTENMDDSTVSFRVKPEELYRVYVEAEAEGLEVVGVFHSHPAPPAPSEKDLEGMKLNQVVWLILSMPSKELRAYVLGEGGVEEVEVAVQAAES